MKFSLLCRAGNRLFQHAFPLYQLLYRPYKAYSDRAERALLRRLLSPGAVVVDGGANIGVYARFLSRLVGPTGVVHAFEPAPDNYRRLRQATRRLSNVRANCLALGERSTTSQLYVSDELNVDHRAYATGLARQTISVEMVALDDYFQPGDRIDLLKLDLQGYELHALRGAERVLRDNIDISLLIELWPYGLQQAGVQWHELLDMLHTFGMDVMLVRSDGLAPLDRGQVRTDFSCYFNLFASRPNTTAGIRSRAASVPVRLS